MFELVSFGNISIMQKLAFDYVLMPWFFRMTKLLDEEIEEDELFWNQDALKEVDVCLVC